MDDGEDLARYLDRDWGLTWGGIAPGATVVLLVLAVILPVCIAAEDDGLQDVAWSPLAQTAHAGVVTGAVLAALPFLNGTASENDVVMIGPLAWACRRSTSRCRSGCCCDGKPGHELRL